MNSKIGNIMCKSKNGDRLGVISATALVMVEAWLFAVVGEVELGYGCVVRWRETVGGRAKLGANVRLKTIGDCS